MRISCRALPLLPLAPLVLLIACAQPGTSAPHDDAGPGGSSSSSSSGSSSGSSSSSSSSGGSSSSSSGGSGSSGGPMDSGTKDVGTAPPDSGGGVDAAAGGCGSFPLCDDFDDAIDVPQHAPSSTLWSLVGTAGCGGLGNPSAPTVYPITIDTQFHNSGAQSVKVVGGDSCGPLMINTSGIAKITGGELYGRFYVHLMDTTVSVHHAVMMSLGLQPDAGLGLNVMDQSSYLELAAENPAGLPSSILLWQTTDSDTLPNTDSTGTQSSAYVAATGFTCVEFHTSASTKAVQVWINGTIVPGLTSPPSPPSSNPPMWTPPSPFAPVSFGLGWLSFNNLGMTAWYDDVALSGSRVGCQ